MGYRLNALRHALQRAHEWVTSPFGWRTLQGKRSHHNGIDLIDSDNGTDYIIAFQQGKVIERRDSVNGYTTNLPAGNYVVLQHGDGYETHYYHMKRSSVSAALGKLLELGDALGYMGSTGWSTGNHLHFGIKRNGVWQDPEPYLRGEKTIPRYSGTDGVGKPVVRDTEKRQLMVVSALLNWRESPSRTSTSKGATTPGDYNITGAAKLAEGYTWYPVSDADGLEGWLADDNGTLSLYPYTEYVGTPDSGDDDVEYNRIHVAGALRARTEPSSASSETIIGNINRGDYRVSDVATDEQGRLWGFVCGAYWICADTDVSVFIPAEKLYFIAVGPMTAGDKDKLVALADELKLTYSVKEQ